MKFAMNKKMIVLASALFFALFALNTTVAVAAVSNDTCIELPGDCDKCKDKDCKGCEAKEAKKETSEKTEGPAPKKACCANKEGEKSSCGDKKEAEAPVKAETKAKKESKK